MNNSKNNNLYQDIFIRKLIHGIFIKYNYLTSDVHIRRYATGHQDISFMFIPLSTLVSPKRGAGVANPMVLPNKNTTVNIQEQVTYLKTLINSILTLKFGNLQSSNKFIILQAPNIFTNPKLIADYINFQLSQDPRQHRYLIQRLLFDFKKTKLLSVASR
jgi:hypothetical protein